MILGICMEYLIGSVVFCVKEAEGREACLLNALRRAEIYDTCRTDGEFRFSCRLRHEKEATACLEELKLPYTLRRKGLLCHLRQLWIKKGAAAALAVCVLLNVWCSGHIWQIHVKGNEQVPTADILETLETLGLYEGSAIRDTDVDRLYLEYLLKENRVTWMHINIEGVTAEVEISERAATPEKTPDKKEICNIVAKCDGVISRVDVYSGGKEVTGGESVVKGQLLISSFFETRMSGFLLRRAKGTVLAQTEPVFEMKIPKAQLVPVEETQWVKHYFRMLQFRLPLDGGTADIRGKCRRKTEEKAVQIGGWTLPFVIETETFIRQECETVPQDTAQARMTYQKAYENWKKDYAEQAEILFEETDEYETDEFFCFRTRLLCRESIGVEKTACINRDEIVKPT